MSIEMYSSDPSMKLPETQKSVGFPSPAEDYLEPMLDLKKALIRNPSATFYGRVKGVSMKDAGVDNGDLLMIDKSLDYRKDALAVCFVNGEFTLKKISTKGDQIILMPVNQNYQSMVINDDPDFMIWGIVTYIIKKAY
jgi:DNA polymerase V